MPFLRYASVQTYIQTDRQAYAHGRRNISHPYGGGRSNQPHYFIKTNAVTVPVLHVNTASSC